MTQWFHSAPAAEGVHLTTEPYANSWFSANLYTVLGRDADLQFDFGMGLSPLRPALNLTGKPVIAVASHAHVDHIGGFHEFSDRRGHAAESEGFATVPGLATFQDEFRSETLGPAVTRPPHRDFRLADWHLTPAPLTATLSEGDRIDLGNRTFTVLHLPGHSPGGIALLDEHAGLLLSADAIYDDTLLDDIIGSSIPDYLATMHRLLTLDCAHVLPGHGAAFGQARMRDIATAYIRSKS